MMRGLTLPELAQKIKANKALKQDYIAPTTRLRMSIPDEPTNGDTGPRLHVAQHGSYPILPLAHSQIASRLEIPQKYYRKMQATQPTLLCRNVNAWFNHKVEKRMIRTLGGATRAFLSNKYQRIENEEIAEVALPVLYDIPDVEIVSAEVTERRMYIQAVAPRMAGEVKVGDEVQAGVIITNSEVGDGSLSVFRMIWRLICLNGMTIGDVFRKTHVGRRIEDNEDLWSDETKRADDAAILLKVRDMVRAAVDEHKFAESVDQLKGLSNVKITGDPSEAVEVLSNKIGATEDERGGILRALIEGGDLSAWGMVNAVTAQAHTARDYDRAVEFEAAGGNLVNLHKSEWAEVLEAA